MLFARQSQSVDKYPLGQELSDEDRQRLLRYTLYWQYYLGRHWAWRREEGEPQVTLNYVKAFVNKGIAFMFGKGFTINIPDLTKGLIGPTLEEIWKYNNKPLWTFEASQTGSVSGDLFVKVAYQEPDEQNDLQEGMVRLIVMNSSHCFPVWSPHDRNVMEKFKIAYEYVIPVAPEDARNTNAKPRTVSYKEVITRDWVRVWDGDNPMKEYKNELGFIPVVHIRNFAVAGASFGMSDCNDITTPNKEFNEKITNLSDIINYHQAPVTVIFGARATTLEKGANKVWSGLPKDARVENLGMQTDLGNSLAFIKALKGAMHEISGVPESSLGQTGGVSNTSGIALEIAMQPLTDLKMLKTLTYSPGLEMVNRMALKVFEMRRGIKFLDLLRGSDVPGAADLPDTFDVFEHKVEFPSTLPKDRLVQLQEIQYRMSSAYPTITPPMALKELGYSQAEIPKILEEIKLWMPVMRPAPPQMDENGNQIGDNTPKPPETQDSPMVYRPKPPKAAAQSAEGSVEGGGQQTPHLGIIRGSDISGGAVYNPTAG